MDHPSTKNKLTASNGFSLISFYLSKKFLSFLIWEDDHCKTDLATTTVHCCVLLDFQNYWGLFTLELLKHIKLFLTEFPTLSYWDHWVLLRAAAPPGSCEPISVGDGTARRSLRTRRLNAALRALTFSSSFAHRALIKLGLRVRISARNNLAQLQWQKAIQFKKYRLTKYCWMQGAARQSCLAMAVIADYHSPLQWESTLQ